MKDVSRLSSLPSVDALARALSALSDTETVVSEILGMTGEELRAKARDERLHVEIVEGVLNDVAQWAWDIAEKSGFHEYNAERDLIVAAVRSARARVEEGGSLPVEVVEALLMMEKKTRMPVPVPEKLLMMDGEIAEAMEVYRNPRMELHKTYVEEGGALVERKEDDVDPRKKSEGFGTELGDALIRGLHLSREMGLNIGRAVLRKMLQNAQREYRHGGKRA